MKTLFSKRWVKSSLLVACLLTIILVLYFIFKPCGHDWLEANCDNPKTCSLCEITEGEPLGHKWVEANCETPKTCSLCNTTEGEPLGHKWVEATCDVAATCEVCNETNGEPLGHQWKDATCLESKTCSVCSITEGEPLGHNWQGPTMTKPKTCSNCGETTGISLIDETTDHSAVCAKAGCSYPVKANSNGASTLCIFHCCFDNQCLGVPVNGSNFCQTHYDKMMFPFG